MKLRFVEREIKEYIHGTEYFTKKKVRVLQYQERETGADYSRLVWIDVPCVNENGEEVKL